MKTYPAAAVALLLLAWVLPASAATSKEEVANLIKQLKGNEAMNSRAAAALEKLGPDDKEAGPVPLDALKKAPARVTAPVLVNARVAIGPPAVPDLTEALKHNKEEVRAAAAQALKRIGLPAKEAVPAL